MSFIWKHNMNLFIIKIEHVENNDLSLSLLIMIGLTWLCESQSCINSPKKDDVEELLLMDLMKFTSK